MCEWNTWVNIMFICCWGNKCILGDILTLLDSLLYMYVCMCVASGVNSLDTGNAVSGYGVTAVFYWQLFHTPGVQVWAIFNECHKSLPRRWVRVQMFDGPGPGPALFLSWNFDAFIFCPSKIGQKWKRRFHNVMFLSR